MGRVAARDEADVPEPHAAFELDRDVVVDDLRRGRPSDVEGAHGELGPRLADGLGGDHPDRLAVVHDLAPREVPPVAAGADPEPGLAGDRRPHLDLLDGVVVELVHEALVEQRAGRDDQLLAVVRDAPDLDRRHPPEDPLAERLHHVPALDEGGDEEPFLRAAVVLGHHQVLGDVHQPAGQVARVRGLEGGVGEPLARPVGGDEVLEDVEPLAEVRVDRGLDDGAVRLRHQAPHPGELPDLGGRAARPGVRHREDGVERRLPDLLALRIAHHLGADLLHHGVRHLVVGLRPDVDHLVVALAVGQEAGPELLLDLLHLPFGPREDVALLLRDLHVLDPDGDPRAGRVAEPGVHELIGEDDGLLQAHLPVADVDEVRDGPLVHDPVDRLERDAGRDHVVEEASPGRRLDQGPALAARGVRLPDPDPDAGMEPDRPGLERPVHLRGVRERGPRALRGGVLPGHVVEPQHHVLGRHDDRRPVRRREDVVGGHHQGARFELGLERQRHVHRHLIAVEVGVERGAHQGMELDRLAFDEHGLEGLDAEAMQGRGAVEQDRVLADHLLQDVPHLRAFALHELLRGLDGGRELAHLELPVHERPEQLEGHLLGQAALVELQGRPDHDHGPSRVVDPLAEQVLAEAPLLALDHVRERLQGPLVRAGDGAPPAAVVEEGVHRLLQHPLLVAHDDLGRVEVEQALEPVVAVDDPPVEVVQVGGGEPPAFEGHERAQLRRQHGEHPEHHPLRLVAGILETFQELEALGELLRARFRAGRLELRPHLPDLVLEVRGPQQLADRLRAHAGVEIVPVLLERVVVHLVGEELAPLQVRHARLDHHVGLEVERPLDLAEGHVEHQPDARREGLEIPDVGDRARELDVAHPLPAHLGERDLHPALLADHPAVLQALVLPAQALVVLDRAEDLGAEQPVALRLEGAVVDRLRLLDLAKRPRPDLLRGGEPDPDRLEAVAAELLLVKIDQISHFTSPVTLAEPVVASSFPCAVMRL